MLVGSTSRIVAGGKAVQTVYWRSSQKSGDKMIKIGKTMVYGKSVPNSNATPVTSPIRTSI